MALENKQPSYFLLLGPSGAGLSSAINFFTEFGFLVLGNLFPDQFLDFLDTTQTIQPQRDTLLSLVLRPDDLEHLDRLGQTLAQLKSTLPNLKILYLDAPESVLVQRYLHSGKQHPFEKNGLQQAVALEKSLYEKLFFLKDYSIDTSTIPPQELRNKIAKVLGLSLNQEDFTVYLTSFGFKRGMPLDSEMVFDMRFLKNPFYVETLRPLTGLDQPVRDYIFSFPEASEFFEQWKSLISGILPCYQKEGKTRLSISIGCTGGQHRSVCMTELLADYLKQVHPSYNIVVVHREMAGWPQANQTSAGIGDKA